MASTGMKANALGAGTGAAGILILFWNHLVPFLIGLGSANIAAQWPQITAEMAVFLSPAVIAIFYRLLGVTVPASAEPAAPTAPVVAEPEPTPIPDGGGREAPVPFA